MPLKILNHGLNSTRFKRSSQISLRLNQLSNILQIRFVVRVKILSINQLFSQFTRILAQILRWSIYLVLLEFLWQGLTNQITSSKSQEVCVADTSATLEQLFFVFCQQMQIWLPQMVFKWQEQWIQKVLELSVSSPKLISWTKVPVPKEWSREKMFNWD